MMQLNDGYQRDDFLKFLEEDFLTDFKKDVRPVNTSGLSSIQKAGYLGESRSLDLQVFEFSFEGSPNKRVALTKDAFSVMRSSAIYKALAIFYSPENKDWRFSLMTASPEPTEKGRVSLSYSNPKRLSFFLGPNAKINTPTKFLISKGKVADFEDLKNRFSIEVVNKEFYKEISQAFTKLVGGSLKLPSTQDKSQTNLEFAVRLIGRVIFCWFLREKKSQAGLALMPKELLSLEAVKENGDYYHKILEPIFFEVLNKPVESRRGDFAKRPFSPVPYLNGGLFSPQDDDYYERADGDLQSQYHNTLVIPDNWFKDFFEILETYNFTIDENTSYDEELSIDPEMLGRIFENLLAEINPETGESTRKSTGSYYTPRVIVDYMVDESLLLYLKNQTTIEEKKLKAVMSYDLSDDEESPATANEKQKIIDALEKVKILDPACGSGAFPIGALQKIVFILQQIDPEGQLWFKKQIKNTSPEIKRVVEREFAHKNFDYIRKLCIIRENIYGVDIQPIATEISRLRCFLTLVVDEHIQDDLENRGIEPLPNLDFKFVTANTLTGLPNSQAASQIGLFEDDAGIKELKELRNMFFNASGTERDQLKLRFTQAQNRIFQKLIGGGRSAHADLTSKLTGWEPFRHNASTWFDPEWMFGIKEGFDIVIANPPYVNIANITDAGFRDYLKKHYKTSKNKSDLYGFFTEKGVSLAKDGGILNYIMSNSWLGTNSFSKFRKFLIDETKIIQMVRLPPGIFEAATVTTLLIFLQKSKASNNHKIKLKEFGKDSFSSLGYGLPYQRIKNTPQYGFSFKRDIKFRINTTKIGQFVHFSLGIKTSNDKEFILNTKKDENTFKVLRGKDVESYSYHWAGKWIWYMPVLMMKKVGAGPRKIEYFLQEKILIKDVCTKIIAAYDNENYLTTDTLTILYGSKKYNLKFILGLLNSKLVNRWFKTNFEAGLHIKINQLSEIPIPDISESQEENVTEIVDKILRLTKSKDYFQDSSKLDLVKQYEYQTDQMVYKLYGLTPEEIEIVEGKNG